jgi:transcriptional regulator with XRE-family HTH domain
MNTYNYTEDEVKAEMRREFAKSSMSQVAREKGISVSFLSDIVNDRPGTWVSEAVAQAFGFVREVTTEVTFRKASEGPVAQSDRATVS